MDKKTKAEIRKILDTLKNDLDYANNSLERLDYVYEDAETPVNDAHDPEKGTNRPSQGSDNPYGMVAVCVHYTLGWGVAEALGAEVDKAIFRAYRRVVAIAGGSNIGHHEMEYDNVGLAVDLYCDGADRLVYLHLELVRTERSILEEAFADNGEGSLIRALH
jgi:hypothetical protein